MKLENKIPLVTREKILQHSYRFLASILTSLKNIDMKRYLLNRYSSNKIVTNLQNLGYGFV